MYSSWEPETVPLPELRVKVGKVQYRRGKKGWNIKLIVKQMLKVAE